MTDEEEEEEEREEERIGASPFPSTHTELFKDAMTPQDKYEVDGEVMIPRDFKVGNLPTADLYKVQFLLQNAKIFAIHAKKYDINLENLIQQIQKDAYIIVVTSTSHQGVLLKLFTTFRHEIKKEKIEPKKRRFW